LGGCRADFFVLEPEIEALSDSPKLGYGSTVAMPELSTLNEIALLATDFH